MAAMPRPSLALSDALGHAATDKRLEILRRVAAVGSISQAARDAGVSYKAAWQALDTLSNLAGAPLVERAVGGAGGGGARLTPAGIDVLHAAEATARVREAVLGRMAAGAGRAAQPLPGLGLRTSMRNHFPSTVRAVLPRAGALDVRLALAGGGGELVARITRESAQLLGLARGLDVLGLCKATAVDVRPAAAGASQCLAGTIVRAPRATGGEATLELPGGLRLVGFAAAGSGLRAGDAAVAVIDAAAVVIGLQG